MVDGNFGVRCDWPPKNQNIVVGSLARRSVVGGRESSTFTTMKTVESLSHVGRYTLSDMDSGAAGLAGFGFLPNFGRSAGVVVCGSTAGKQLRQ